MDDYERASIREGDEINQLEFAIKKAEKKKDINFAKKLRDKGMDIDFIIEMTGLTKEEIGNL